MTKHVAVPDTVRRVVEDLVHAVAAVIDRDQLEEFPNFFVPDGVYKVCSRFNLDRGLPAAHINCSSRGMIVDRIASLRQANVYQKHFYRHFISGITVQQEPDEIVSRANYMVVRIMEDGSSTLFSTGEYRDRIVIDGSAALFRERVVVFDSKSIETLLVIPL